MTSGGRSASTDAASGRLETWNLPLNLAQENPYFVVHGDNLAGTVKESAHAPFTLRMGARRGSHSRVRPSAVPQLRRQPPRDSRASARLNRRGTGADVRSRWPLARPSV